MRKETSTKDLINNWKTIREFSDDVGCGYEAARKMRDRNSIAPEHWNNVLMASKSKGLNWVTVDWLIKLRSRPSKQDKAA